MFTVPNSTLTPCLSNLGMCEPKGYVHEGERTESCPFIDFPQLNRLSPNIDENGISLDIMTICSHIQVLRIKIVITTDKMS